MIVVDLDSFTNEAIMQIAVDLGCDIKYPDFNLKLNKYEEMMELAENDDERNIILKMINADKVKFYKEFNEYIRSLKQWLEDHYGFEE